MENENLTSEHQETVQETQSSLHSVTPLSKYLAMALFVALPFIGGWIGYTYAPEKVVEKEVVKEVEKIVTEQAQGLSSNQYAISEDEYAVVTTKHLYRNSVHEPGRLTTIDNDKYKISFEHSSSQVFDDPFIREPDHWTQATQINIRDGSSPEKETLMGINVHNSGYCRLSMCELDTLTSFKLSNMEWSYLGSHRYCDVGQCANFEYLYKTTFADFTVYISTENPLHETNESTGKTTFKEMPETRMSNPKDVSKIFESLSLDTKVGGETN